MAILPCDYCGTSSGQHGSWDTLITIICSKCQEKRENGEKLNKRYEK